MKYTRKEEIPEDEEYKASSYNEIPTTGVLRAFLKRVQCVYCSNHMFGTETDESETTGDGLF